MRAVTVFCAPKTALLSCQWLEIFVSPNIGRSRSGGTYTHLSGMAKSPSARLGHPRRFAIDTSSPAKLTHHLFRFPAKFHPPVAQTLVQDYSDEGDCILDPFCGSGTVLIEAIRAGRDAVGTDIDPVAAFVSRVKTRRLRVVTLQATILLLRCELDHVCRTNSEYKHRMFADITPQTYARNISQENLFVPAIPNLHHWFRRYVVVDLARILQRIENLDAPITHREFLRLCALRQSSETPQMQTRYLCPGLKLRRTCLRRTKLAGS